MCAHAAWLSSTEGAVDQPRTAVERGEDAPAPRAIRRRARAAALAPPATTTTSPCGASRSRFAVRTRPRAPPSERPGRRPSNGGETSMPRMPRSAPRRSSASRSGSPAGAAGTLRQRKLALGRSTGGAPLLPVQFGDLLQQAGAAAGPDRVQRADLGQPFGDRPPGVGAQPQVLERGVGLSGRDPLGLGLADAVDVARAPAGRAGVAASTTSCDLPSPLSRPRPASLRRPAIPWSAAQPTGTGGDPQRARSGARAAAHPASSRSRVAVHSRARG
ncbi:hypothetical protein SANTM175S_07085 [Streptomyces antimycoticus]